MPRAKGGAKTRQRRKKVLKQAKGYWAAGGGSTAQPRRPSCARGPSPTRDRKQKKRRARGALDHSGQCRLPRGSDCPTRCSWTASRRRGRAGSEGPRRAGRPRSHRLRQAGGDGAKTAQPRLSVASGPIRASSSPSTRALARHRVGAAHQRPTSSRSASVSSAAGGADRSSCARSASLPRRASGRSWAPPANEAKAELEAALEARLADARERERRRQRAPRARPDLTLPGAGPPRGARPSPHAGAATRSSRSSRGLGFSVAEGPEIETRLLQLRGPQLPRRPSRARHAGHVLLSRRTRCCAPTPRRCRSARCRRSARPCASSSRGASTAAT